MYLSSKLSGGVELYLNLNIGFVPNSPVSNLKLSRSTYSIFSFFSPKGAKGKCLELAKIQFVASFKCYQMRLILHAILATSVPLGVLIRKFG